MTQTADHVIAFLVAQGAESQAHGAGRRLLEHLVGTYEVVRRWKQPRALQHAALIHSLYGTETYRHQLVDISRRAEVAEIAGEQAERLAYLFSVVPRSSLFTGTPGIRATREESDALVLLHMANTAEQARAEDGSPGAWLVKVREFGELLIDSEAVKLPLFVAHLAGLTHEDETLTRRAYADALAAADAPRAANYLALAAAACHVVAEPCIWLAYLARCLGEVENARRWARCGRQRLAELGTAWDKRLTFDEWRELAERLERSGAPCPVSGVRDPRNLLEAVGGSSPTPRPAFVRTGRDRFQRYVHGFAVAERPAALGVYPDLDSQPWYDAMSFPVARYLESHFAEVRDEILALEASRFHPESERIERTGEWEVAFFYERGRRRPEVCDACPVTTRGIESAATVRTMAGLIYISRMRAGTHIRAHRGPTNLRLRCHLGIKIPDGDCAIRVGDEVRPWAEGRCLVFDDFFEHEAWNHTDEDRIVLIVDLWHPELSAAEVRLLRGLHRYAATYGRQLGRYWSRNAAAEASRQT